MIDRPTTDEKNAEQISGTVEQVVFRNETNGFSVIELLTKEKTVITAVGSFAQISPGEDLELTGKWDTHATFGRQFKITECRRKLPDTTAKLFRYLASGAGKGVGAKTAAKIIEWFGEDTLSVLEGAPDRLAVIPGISKKRAAEICNEFNHQYAMRKVLIELEQYGVSPAECTSIYKYFGVNALEVIRENPYILCASVNGFSFERVEKLCRDMQLAPLSQYRNEAGVLYILKHNLYTNGHTCLPRRKLAGPCENLLSIDAGDANATLDALVEKKLLVECTINDEPFLFLPEIYQAEVMIAKRLHRAIRFSPAPVREISDEIDAIEEKNGIRYAAGQRLAITTAAEKGLLILTGGPGTGKTTAVRGIIDIFERHHIDILLCAPTGMAAKRMSEVTGRDAKTIHRLLEVEWNEDDKPHFRRDEQNPLSAGAVIVDEMSMVDAELFSSLMRALPIGCRIILVGDSDQLPSVGPGNVLGDIVSSSGMPVVCLTEIFRQALKSLIVMNAHRIIHGEAPQLDRSDADFFFLPRSGAPETADTVIQLISRRLPDAYGFSPIDDIQILCPSKKFECGTAHINQRLQAVLNPPAQSKSELRTSGGRVFREGDRVMQVRNNYNIHWVRDGFEEGDGIFNGDIGIIEKINFLTSQMRIRFDDRISEYPSDNLSELELAYAVTVHKSQGSEYPAVIIPVFDCPSPLLYRNLLYTAVTRAKKILILVGSKERILQMTDNDRHNKRYSGLKSFLESVSGNYSVSSLYNF